MAEKNILSVVEKSVLLFDGDYAHPFSDGTRMVGEVIKEISEQLYESEKLLAGELACELLQPDSQGWKKGRLKICLEFTEDEDSPAEVAEVMERADITVVDAPVTSPLDSIRQMDERTEDEA